jgi:acetoin utilization deacetylase AcuC-like enzyme
MIIKIWGDDARSKSSYFPAELRGYYLASRLPKRQWWDARTTRLAKPSIYVSAGFDGHREDDMGNLGLTEADYAWVARQIMTLANCHAGGGVISCLEGGYALDALGPSGAAHVKVLIGAD